MITVNDRKMEIFKFPGGEINVRVPHFIHSEIVTIKAFLKNSDDIMALLLTVDAIRRICCIEKLNLVLPYFPYGRQDRVCNYREAFSLSVMANLINSLNFNRVTIYDPHSDVTPALIKNCNIIPLKDIFNQFDPVSDLIFKNHILVVPDAGMIKKAHTISRLFQTELLCFKERDLRTGNIIDIGIYQPEKITDNHLLVVDDICDGGATFIKLAEKLRQYRPASLSLYVTHGIFSKGLKGMKEAGINRFFTQNGEVFENRDGLIVYEKH